MIISFSPAIMDGVLAVTRSGDALTIDGEAYDFSTLPDGATIPAGEVPSDWITGPVERIDGDLHLTLLLPCRYDAPHERLYPQPIVDPADGPIVFPGD
ncbi:hypothetical protein [Shinella pollutisoli]|uniref:Uncharacterized protein n=1 Tax=Shinella pollutisoli TaxID=2250594 RepID=A0ABV7DIE9_9HYPH|nr:hypothetical protein [Shinella pollutisoli]